MTRSPGTRIGRLPWLRRPHRTARLRLTLLSGALFVLSGVVLLTITYLLFSRTASTSEQRRSGSVPSTPSGLSSGAGQVHFTRGSAISGGSAIGQVAADKYTLLIASAIALAIVAVLALLLGWFVAGRMLRPVRTITATAQRISASNLNERLALEDADEEFKQLGDTLDDLFARLQAAFEAQQHFVTNASHELRTPLTAERTLLQVALDDHDTTNATWRSTAKEVLASNREQEHLIEALLTLASSEGGLDHYERIDLAAICDAVLLRPGLNPDTRGLRIGTAIRSAPLDGDPRLIERLVANLIHNAITHNVTAGSIEISTTVINGSAVLAVANTGADIPITEIDRLFEPFQRLDPHRTHHNDGHGLGLSIVTAIANVHGATISARPGPQGGLIIEISFLPPRSQLSTVP